MILPLAVVALSTYLTLEEDVPREFGAVNWGRQLEPALVRAAATKKPVMLLFQEVPG